MISAVSRSSRLGKYRYSAEETIPSSRATARSDSPFPPTSASWRRASSLISRVSSARARSRAVWLALTGLIRTPNKRSVHKNESTALDFISCFVFTDLNREHRSRKLAEGESHGHPLRRTRPGHQDLQRHCRLAHQAGPVRLGLP